MNVILYKSFLLGFLLFSFPMSSPCFGVEGKENITLQARNKDIEALFEQADQYTEQGKHQESIKILQRALRLSQQAGDKRNEAFTYSKIGTNYDRLGKSQLALDQYNKALLIFQQISDRSGETKILNLIGLVYFNIGELEQALNYYNQALPRTNESGDR